MPSIHRSARVKYSASAMFDLVNDIESYPLFMPGCRRARIIEKREDELVGELQLGAGPVSQRFTTRNSLDRPHSISMALVDGNFRKFAGQWRFKALTADSCEVSLSMEFEFSRPLLDAAAGGMFSRMANAQVDAVVERARRVYGS